MKGFVNEQVGLQQSIKSSENHSSPLARQPLVEDDDIDYNYDQ